MTWLQNQLKQTETNSRAVQLQLRQKEVAGARTLQELEQTTMQSLKDQLEINKLKELLREEQMREVPA